MEAELLVSRVLGETRVALLEDGVTQEVFLEREHERSVVGNIYRGRITRVLPGMQAAFVEIGLPRAAFLYVDDIVYDDGDDEREEREDLESDEEAPPPRPSIRELISEGQEVTVQVTKAPLGTKGARVTTYITIPGRSVVFMPTMDRLGVSRKIQDEEERKRLKEVMETQRQGQPGGFIARTACVGLEDAEIARDMSFVRSLWADVERKSRGTSAPSLIQADLDLVLRATRDMFTEHILRMTVDQPSEAERIRALLERFAPHLAERIVVHPEGGAPLFDAFGVEQAIGRALERRVPLSSGGSLVVDEAEALTAIDVNTGSFVGSRDLEATILRTNLEAAAEVAHQIRLRNLGGIIIIDFIDMQLPENRSLVQSAFQTALERDRARSHVLPMTEFGLVELTRKRVRPSMGRTLTEPCPYCEGRGWVRSRASICQSILRSIRARVGTDLGKGLIVSAMPEVATALTGAYRGRLEAVEAELGLPVVIEARAELHQERFEVVVRR